MAVSTTFRIPRNFEGFHRLEQALFADNTVRAMDPIADGLLQHIKQLQNLVATLHYNPIELASGATDLVDEIEETKITGEEERYSGIDLVDFRGNLDGAMELVHQFAPFLTKKDPGLLAVINARNQIVDAALARYEATPGYDDSGFVAYSMVTTPERRETSRTSSTGWPKRFRRCSSRSPYKAPRRRDARRHRCPRNRTSRRGAEPSWVPRWWPRGSRHGRGVERWTRRVFAGEDLDASRFGQ